MEILSWRNAVLCSLKSWCSDTRYGINRHNLSVEYKPMSREVYTIWFETLRNVAHFSEEKVYWGVKTCALSSIQVWRKCIQGVTCSSLDPVSSRVDRLCCHITRGDVEEQSCLFVKRSPQFCLLFDGDWTWMIDSSTLKIHICQRRVALFAPFSIFIIKLFVFLEAWTLGKHICKILSLCEWRLVCHFEACFKKFWACSSIFILTQVSRSLHLFF